MIDERHSDLLGLEHSRYESGIVLHSLRIQAGAGEREDERLDVVGADPEDPGIPKPRIFARQLTRDVHISSYRGRAERGSAQDGKIISSITEGTGSIIDLPVLVYPSGSIRENLPFVGPGERLPHWPAAPVLSGVSEYTPHPRW